MSKREVEVGKRYTFIKGEVRSYASMVHLEELPDKYGFMSYLYSDNRSSVCCIVQEATCIKPKNCYYYRLCHGRNFGVFSRNSSYPFSAL